MQKILIGIDPGQKNGFAILKEGNLELKTLKLYELFFKIDDMLKNKGEAYLQVYIENPNLWHNFKNSPNAADRLQGAGSVKGTFAHITEFLTDRNINWVGLRPDKQRNALGEHSNRDLFNKITGYTGACSTHARDAAMLIINMK